MAAKPVDFDLHRCAAFERGFEFGQFIVKQCDRLLGQAKTLLGRLQFNIEGIEVCFEGDDGARRRVAALAKDIRVEAKQNRVRFNFPARLNPVRPFGHLGREFGCDGGLPDGSGGAESGE
ncbi:hypothetical protein ABWH91_06870 [Phycisphaerales bacterium ac7]